MSEDNLEKRVTDLQNTVNNQSGQIAGLEQKSPAIEDKVQALQADVENLKKQLEAINRELMRRGQ